MSLILCMVLRKTMQKNNLNKVSVSFWSYVLAIGVNFIFALFNINTLWSFYASLIFGIIVSIVNIFSVKDIKHVLIKYIGIVLGLNGLNLVLSVTTLNINFLGLFYIYSLGTTSLILIILGLYALFKEQGE